MPTITPYRRDTPGKRGLRFRTSLESGERAVASFGLFMNTREIAHKFVACVEGEHDLAIDEIFPDHDLMREGLSITYLIGREGIEQL